MATTFSRKAGQKPSETPQVDIELTWSRDEKGYSEGRNFGHLAFAVDDIYETCARLMEAGVATPAGLFQLHIMPQTQETMPGRRPGHPDEGRRKNAWPWIAGSIVCILAICWQFPAMTGKKVLNKGAHLRRDLRYGGNGPCRCLEEGGPCVQSRWPHGYAYHGGTI